MNVIIKFFLIALWLDCGDYERKEVYAYINLLDDNNDCQQNAKISRNSDYIDFFGFHQDDRYSLITDHDHSDSEYVVEKLINIINNDN